MNASLGKNSFILHPYVKHISYKCRLWAVTWVINYNSNDRPRNNNLHQLSALVITYFGH